MFPIGTCVVHALTYSCLWTETESSHLCEDSSPWPIVISTMYCTHLTMRNSAQFIYFQLESGQFGVTEVELGPADVFMVGTCTSWCIYDWTDRMKWFQSELKPVNLFPLGAQATWGGSHTDSDKLTPFQLELRPLGLAPIQKQTSWIRCTWKSGPDDVIPFWT